jgi:hypothetical protein
VDLNPRLEARRAREEQLLERLLEEARKISALIADAPLPPSCAICGGRHHRQEDPRCAACGIDISACDYLCRRCTAVELRLERDWEARQGRRGELRELR